MSIVDQLFANPGHYVGRDTVEGTEYVGGARVVVSRLPGGAGVSLDYEIYNPLAEGPVLGHHEHTIIGRTDDGTTIMVIAHTHGDGISIMREADPGVFEQTDPAPPYPMKVVVSVPEPGRLRHAWWYGRPGGEAVERDIAELELLSP